MNSEQILLNKWRILLLEKQLKVLYLFKQIAWKN